MRAGDGVAQKVDAGIELNYVEWGEDGKPVVVLLHGLTGHARNFEALAQELSNEFHCFAPDLRGHGDSAWSTVGDYRLSTLARDLDTFLQSRGLRRVALVGTAARADVALAFAGARPDWISHLVLNDSAPELSDAGLERIRRHLAESPEEFESLDAAVDWWRATFPILADYSEASIRRFVGHSVRAAADGTMRWKFDPRFRELSPQSIRDVDLIVSAGRVTCPTLVLRGAKSDVVSEFLAKQLVEGLTRSGGGDGAQLVPIDGVGHGRRWRSPKHWTR